jgi:S-(hydroxymethyl)glutathione dehydrogenase/alcohol dehydrogenase
MTMTLSPVTPGSIVAIFGAGPIGLSAVQGARLMGAAQIIVVEPISVRRELALKLGATTVFDPNIEGDQLVDKIRYLCQGESDSFYSGGRPRFGERHLGPDFVIEAVGGDRFPPKLEVGPDPAGILPLQQAWELCPGGSDLLTCGVGQVGNVSFPGGRWTNSSKNHLSSQFGGTHMKRDMPRYVSLIEAGLFDAESLATSTFALEETSDGYQATADRTTVSSVIVMS